MPRNPPAKEPEPRVTPVTGFRLTQEDKDGLDTLAKRWGEQGRPLDRTATIREMIRRCL